MITTPPSPYLTTFIHSIDVTSEPSLGSLSSTRPQNVLPCWLVIPVQNQQRAPETFHTIWRRGIPHIRTHVASLEATAVGSLFCLLSSTCGMNFMLSFMNVCLTAPVCFWPPPLSMYQISCPASSDYLLLCPSCSTAAECLAAVQLGVIAEVVRQYSSSIGGRSVEFPVLC